jgi:glycosyltransferase involved in cell wall biosynthesis
VLIVSSTLHIGGAEQVAANLARHVSSAGFEVIACYLKENGAVGEQMLRAGVELVPVPGLRPGRRDYLTAIKLRRLIRRRRIDLIHTHDTHGLVDGSICRATLPSLRHVHTFHFGNYPARPRRPRAIERTFWRFPDALIAVGHVQAATIRDYYGIPADRLRTIWNGVEVPRIPSPKRPSDVPIMTSISTLIPQKGLECLLDAAAILKSSGEQFVLKIAGEGRLRTALEDRARFLGLADCVQFLGWVPQASRNLLPACDIFVQSSLWEAMSVVVLEAMAAAKPMVVTAVGENSQVVRDGETGLLVPPGDPRALAASLRALLRDRSLRERLGGAARTRLEERFSIQRMIATHQELYRELVTSRAPE